MPSFDSNIRFVYFRAKGVREWIFPSHSFLYFVAGRIIRTSSLLFVNIMKDKRSQRKNAQVRESRSMYTSISLAYPLKKLLKKKWKNPNGW